MKKKITRLAQLASYKTAAEILCTVVKDFGSMSLSETERCIESVSVDDFAVRVKANLPDNKNIWLLVGILPNRKPSPYDLIGKDELDQILLDENLYKLCFVWVIPNPDKPPKFNPITSEMIKKFADADKNLLDMISMSVILPNDEFWK